MRPSANPTTTTITNDNRNLHAGDNLPSPPSKVRRRKLRRLLRTHPETKSEDSGRILGEVVVREVDHREAYESLQDYEAETDSDAEELLAQATAWRRSGDEDDFMHFVDYVYQEMWNQELAEKKEKEKEKETASTPPPPTKRRHRQRRRHRTERKGRERTSTPPHTQTSLAPQFSVVLHAVPTGYVLGDIHKWLEIDNTHLAIASTRWLLGAGRRAGKSRSSVVL